MEPRLIATFAPMNFAVIISVALLAAALGVALYRVAAGAARQRQSGDFKFLIESLDVAAFNNLVDPAEEEFLRRELPPPLFRTIQRLRLRAAIEYVSCASRNAVLLMRMGKSMAAAPGREYSQQAGELARAAMQLRLLSLFVLCLLWVKMAFPALRLSLRGVSALHERLVAQQAVLGRLKSSGRLLTT